MLLKDKKNMIFSYFPNFFNLLQVNSSILLSSDQKIEYLHKFYVTIQCEIICQIILQLVQKKEKNQSRQQDMSSLLQKLANIFFGSFDESSLLEGATDIILVKWQSGQIQCSPLIVNFGVQTTTSITRLVKLYINDKIVENIIFKLDKYGYIHPMHPSQNILKQIDKYLTNQQTKNKITFELQNQYRISSELYVYNQFDKIVISDLDGTLTRSDFKGFYHNVNGKNYLHDGYYELIEALDKREIKIVWLTMRPISLYNFSKSYIEKHTKINGPLITQPEQLLTAAKKQAFKQSVIVKTSLLQNIRKLFPEFRNPFIGGLGNRINDAIAYKKAGIPENSIFIIDTQSSVHYLGSEEKITYHEMSQDLDLYFPEFQLEKRFTQSQYAQSTASGFNYFKMMHKHTIS